MIALCTAILVSQALSAAAGDDAQAEAPEAPTSLEALMEHFASVGGVRARFEEVRTLSLLAVPIETRGMLYFSPPDRLARITSHPGASRVVVFGDHVVLSDETGRRELDLGSSEIAQALVGNLAVLLRGDLPEVLERYEVDYAAEGGEWVLTLRPRSRVVRGVIERIRVVGLGGALASMETVESNGDTTMARFFDVESGIDLSQAAVFDLEPSGAKR